MDSAEMKKELTAMLSVLQGIENKIKNILTKINTENSKEG